MGWGIGWVAWRETPRQKCLTVLCCKKGVAVHRQGQHQSLSASCFSTRSRGDARAGVFRAAFKTWSWAARFCSSGGVVTRRQWWPGVVPGSTHPLQTDLGARGPATWSPSPQFRAPLAALVKTGHRRASSDTLSTGGSSPALKLFCFSCSWSARTTVFFLHYSVQEAVKSQPCRAVQA